MPYKIAPTVIDTDIGFLLSPPEGRSKLGYTGANYRPPEKPIGYYLDLLIENTERTLRGTGRFMGKPVLSYPRQLFDAECLINAAWGARRALENRRCPDLYFAEVRRVAKKYGMTMKAPCDLIGTVVGITVVWGDLNVSLKKIA